MHLLCIPFIHLMLISITIGLAYLKPRSISDRWTEFSVFAYMQDAGLACISVITCVLLTALLE